MESHKRASGQNLMYHFNMESMVKKLTTLKKPRHPTPDLKLPPPLYKVSFSSKLGLPSITSARTMEKEN